MTTTGFQYGAFAVSNAADGLVHTSTRADCFASQLPYGESKRTLQVDIVVYDNLDRSLRTYEVKRGNGEHDAGKVRSIMRDLICTHVLLKSYAGARDLSFRADRNHHPFTRGFAAVLRLRVRSRRA